MQKAIKKVRQEVIEAQMDSVVKEVTTLEIQHDFMSKDHDEKVKKATNIKKKEERENAISSLAQHKLQKITPMLDNIAYKTEYYNYLVALK